MKARLISQETVYLYHIGLNSQRGQEITQALGEISVQVKEIKDCLLYTSRLPSVCGGGSDSQKAGDTVRDIKAAALFYF